MCQGILVEMSNMKSEKKNLSGGKTWSLKLLPGKTICGTTPPIHTRLNKLGGDFTFLLLLAIPPKLLTCGNCCTMVLKMSV